MVGFVFGLKNGVLRIVVGKFSVFCSGRFIVFIVCGVIYYLL